MKNEFVLFIIIDLVSVIHMLQMVNFYDQLAFLKFHMNGSVLNKANYFSII